jgi:response regulator RpfG family c-di-GMP phosphodiesterase
VAQPVVLAVDDDGDVLEVLKQALGKRYGADYQIITERSPAVGLGVLERLRSQDASVAVVIADQWMPQLTGVEFLAQAHQLHPSARRMLLIGVLDRSVNEPMSQAMALGRIDGWLWKPWEPAEEHLYLPVSEQLSEWIRATVGSAMAYNFLVGDRDQAFLLPPDLRDWLPADHLTWFILDVVDQLDLGPFLKAYRADGHGGPPTSPGCC